MESELPWLDPEYLSEDDSVLDYFNYRTHFRDKRRRFDNDQMCGRKLSSCDHHDLDRDSFIEEGRTL